MLCDFVIFSILKTEFKLEFLIAELNFFKLLIYLVLKYKSSSLNLFAQYSLLRS